MTGAIYTSAHEHMVILLKQKIIFGIEWEKEQLFFSWLDCLVSVVAITKFVVNHLELRREK